MTSILEPSKSVSYLFLLLSLCVFSVVVLISLARCWLSITFGSVAIFHPFWSSERFVSFVVVFDPLDVISQSFFPALTKIVGTLGPKSRSVEVIAGCLKAGMSGNCDYFTIWYVIRLGFSLLVTDVSFFLQWLDSISLGAMLIITRRRWRIWR